jgi:hypothetical protein
MDKITPIAEKIASLLEAEKCTVEESNLVLNKVKDIINGSTFTVHKVN